MAVGVDWKKCIRSGVFRQVGQGRRLGSANQQLLHSRLSLERKNATFAERKATVIDLRHLLPGRIKISRLDPANFLGPPEVVCRQQWRYVIAIEEVIGALDVRGDLALDFVQPGSQL